jgi:hypothetical protein
MLRRAHRKKQGELTREQFEQQWLMRKQIRELHEEARSILKEHLNKQ